MARMPNRPHRSLPCAALPRILASCLLLLAAAGRADAPLSNQQIVQRIDEAVYQRLNAIPRFTVQEQYKIFRNGSTTPAAQETVLTTYIRDQGKDYKPLAQSGSAVLRSYVIDKVLAGEKDVNVPANREGALMTSRNYDLRPEPGTTQRNGLTCIIVDLHPRHKSPHLFTGKVWLDASDYTIVHIEGAPSQSPSIFAGQTNVSRDYAKFSGYAMATHAEAHSHSFFFGDTLITIDYSDYHIDLDPATSTR
jgi:hypothetical protein